MERYMVKNQDRILRTDTYLVRIETADGQVFEDVEPRRLFPFSDPDRYVTFLAKGEKEVAMLTDLANIDEASRRAVEECFMEYYMIPEITDVIQVIDTAGIFKWKVKTDRGIVEFQIRNRNSDIKQEEDALLMRDSNDNRYRIDLAKLDPKSMKKILSYI